MTTGRINQVTVRRQEEQLTTCVANWPKLKRNSRGSGAEAPSSTDDFPIRKLYSQTGSRVAVARKLEPIPTLDN